MTITFEQIAKRAFEIWHDEGEIEGKEKEHWFRAEAELRKKQSKETKEASMKKTPSPKTPAPPKTPKAAAKMLKPGDARL